MEATGRIDLTKSPGGIAGAALRKALDAHLDDLQARFPDVALVEVRVSVAGRLYVRAEPMEGPS